MMFYRGKIVKSKWFRKVLGYWNPIWRTWHKYLGLTTIPGLQSVHNAQGKFATIAWSILFVIGLACTIRDVYISWMDYLAYPVITTINIKQATSLPFPAVTVCNLNPVHCGNLRRLARRNRDTDLGDRLQELYDMTSCIELHWKPRRDNTIKINSILRSKRSDKLITGEVKISSNTTKTTIESIAAVTVSIGEDDEKKPVNQTRSFNDLMNFMALYTNFSEEHRSAMGHDTDEFIRACTFSGKSCSNVTLFFRPLLSTTFGNCFTFMTTRKTVMPGKDYGLSLELFLDQRNYIGGGLSPRAGARVVVHAPSMLPLPDANGVTVPPHTATGLALMEVRLNREKLPYSTNCTSGWERTWYASRITDSYPYTMERCQRVCLQLAFEESCSCTHPNYMDLATEAFPCNLTSEHQNYACASQVLDEFENSIRTCSCNMDCRETMYEMKISQATWPNDNNWCDVAQRFGMARNCKYKMYQSENQIQEKQRVVENVLTIDVFFENLRIQSIVQHPTYKLQTFVGSLGGALSLYLGVTLFMLLEVVEVFLRLTFALCHYGFCMIYQRGSTAMPNKNHRRNLRNGIFYTDFRFGPPRLSSGMQSVKPIKFVW
ncbi:amiloride-sensitive sodium channel subunit gamma-like isoform X2 [Cephus cinctus]|uniref:Amiloride-sensitive sodium channel subunit gamma-like isoform X2 n=1 Tax=Cephus cinctus TaxID=211228 RepID=A0AAJ7W2Y5_CEPCN|nr:amiloride-sensitive sodium channel subunit gamma-like isoform X2 [Cephus cinctus]